ncbi:DoxX-like family protein [Aquimarina amphilecti]|uniref:DoxX-like family protein n=1 Tax=Aquimarina amphilecti TaxID=1038014 RepID=A0A1H7MBV8_AQUAM|nr:DoxX family protein [Aquimarina amphilecti]SEL08683.1 DoxX-like family protein [Aquimarina amphilecti]
MKTDKIIYWISTGILSALFMFSSMMYIFNYPRIEGFFINLGFPIWIIYPLAILKTFGVLAILTKKNNFLKELAYAGFLFDVILALSAHIMVNDREFMPSVIAIIATILSWIYDRKVFGKYTQTFTKS